MKTNNNFSNAFRIAAVAVYSLLPMSNSFAYEQSVHVDITSSAFTASIASDPAFLRNIGLLSRDVANYAPQPAEYGTYPDRIYFSFSPQTINELIEVGAYQEDNGERALNHFYDPLNDEALYVTFPQGRHYLGRKNPEWALGGPYTGGTGATGPHTLSLTKAKDYYFQMLSAPDADDRVRFTGLLFASLGHALHMLQDMAQPDHSRMDIHCNVAKCYFGEVARENIYDPSHYEALTAEEGYFSYSGAYPTVQLATYRDYFNNSDGSGLANFSNRSFVSKDTNFVGTFESPAPFPDFPLPSPATANITENQVTYEASGNSVTVYRKEIYAEYWDAYLGAAPMRDHLTSTATLFEPDIEDLPQSSSQTLFAISDDSYRSAASKLIPRAEGYSVGFLNHFFRGKLGARMANKGFYGLADQASDTGFATITAEVKNASAPLALPNGTQLPQHMGDGMLYAIASYRPNGCYQEDLKGDLHADEQGFAYIPSNCSFNTWGGAEEVRLTSEPIHVSSVADDWTEMSFDFSATPIPFSVTIWQLRVMTFLNQLMRVS